jgi:hypothetical protein
VGLTTLAFIIGQVIPFLKTLNLLGQSLGFISAASRNRWVASSQVNFLASSSVSGLGSFSCHRGDITVRIRHERNREVFSTNRGSREGENPTLLYEKLI